MQNVVHLQQYNTIFLSSKNTQSLPACHATRQTLGDRMLSALNYLGNLLQKTTAEFQTS